MKKSHKLSLSVVILLLVFGINSFAQKYSFKIDAQEVIGKNTGFWKASGTDLLYRLAEEPAGQNLFDRMQLTQSCVYLRNHYTLMPFVREGVEVGIDIYSEDENGNPIYNFTRVNRIYNEFVKRGLKPVVECDYLPEEFLGNASTSGNDEGMNVRNSVPNDWEKWRKFLVAFTQNLVDNFGIEEVKTWYFEVWNEPDGWNKNEIQGFYKLYDVFADAIKSVDPALRIGGPACYHEWFLRDFLEHVCNGENHVTGEKGSPIDFVSYHIYGLSGSWLNKAPQIKPQVQRFTQSVLWLQRMFYKYPELKDIEFHINEWGMSSHYQKTVADYPDLEYRNNEESALFLVKLVDCLYAINDNHGFATDQLLYWGGAWEAHKDDFFVGHRTLTTAGNTPKPIQTGFEMLGQLKQLRLKEDGSKAGGRIGMLATKNKNNEFTLLVYNYNETDDDLSLSDKIEINLNGLNFQKLQVKEIVLDRNNNNTYREWQRQGKPRNSSVADMQKMKEAGDLTITNQYLLETDNGHANLNLSLPRHSMVLVNIVVLN